MQNRNAIKVFTFLFAIVCLYQLSFTWVADGVHEDAIDYANNYIESNKLDLISELQNNSNDSLIDSITINDYLEIELVKRQKYYLDSISSEKVYDIWLKEYTYKECQEREINLGLDLKGGMNVTLEVSVVDVIRALSNNSDDENFNLAITNSQAMQKNSQDDFVTLFANEYKKLSPNNGLAVLFMAQMRDDIKINATNEEVIQVIREEVEDAISRSFNILRSRIDRFGVTQPNIQRLETSGRILVELPGIKEPERARKLLQSTAKLEFWETYEYSELLPSLEDANKFLREDNAFTERVNFITFCLMAINFSVIIIKLTLVTSLFKISILISAVIFFYLLKIVFMKIFGNIFMLRELTKLGIFFSFLFDRVLGIFLFPLVVMLYFFSFEITSILFLLIFIVIIIILTLKLFWLWKIGTKAFGLSHFYIFLYLCSLEIFPVFLLAKGLFVN